MKTLFTVSLVLTLATGCVSESTPVATDQTATVDSSVEPQSDVVEIELVVGESTGDSVVQTVSVGATVRISIVNNDEDDDYHLHGYDVASGEVPAGETATIEVLADRTGSFELESHHSGNLLMTLIVE
mgnify:CR=1 FL=1